MSERPSDTEPPVAGAMSISPGPRDYESILADYCRPITQDDQHTRTEVFTTALLNILSLYGVDDIRRLVLTKGPGSREQLSVTLAFGDARVLSYRVVLPMGVEPFGDPGWVAAELVRQASSTY